MDSPLIIPIQHAEEPRDLIHRCVQALVEGAIVVLPTETVYGVAASVLAPQAVTRLAQIKWRESGQAFTLAIKSAEELWDYVPDLQRLAWRLAQKGWPGPLTIVVDHKNENSLIERLASEVRQHVCPEGTLGFRVPDHFFTLEVLRLLPAPIILTSVNRTGESPAVTAKEAAAKLPEVDIIFDDGPAPLGRASTVVRVHDHGLTLLREGSLPVAKLRQMAATVLVFVCGGNTCRSPMAAALCRRFLANHLQCSPSDLEQRGIVIHSAGLEAFVGQAASPQAIQVMREHGLDIGEHAARPIDERLIREADCIYVMTRHLREALLSRWPDAAPRIQLLDPDGRDIADPFGGSVELYRGCAAAIAQALARRKDELLTLIGPHCDQQD